MARPLPSKVPAYAWLVHAKVVDATIALSVEPLRRPGGVVVWPNGLGQSDSKVPHCRLPPVPSAHRCPQQQVEVVLVHDQVHVLREEQRVRQLGPLLLRAADLPHQCQPRQVVPLLPLQLRPVHPALALYRVGLP